ncbi:MAG TPA: hypothetical protein VFS27_06200 [Blastocatellia bacterium]|jgi:hypothetical protein|nr:hypothetical protein [Blastocatellia bacterium]
MLFRLLNLRRMLRENKDLKARLFELEAELREERAKTERIMLALTDRVLTAAGCFGLPKGVTQPKRREETKPQAPEPSPVAEAYLEAVRLEGLRLGKTPTEIDLMLSRLRRGESVTPQVEEDFVLPD